VRWTGLLVLVVLLGRVPEGWFDVQVRAQSALDDVRANAEAGLASAQRRLGLMYAGGRGVEQDDAEAARWFRRAGEQGEPRAQASLGFSYALGKGVPLDYVEAYRWLDLAVVRSSGENRELFQRNREAVATKMTGAEVINAKRLARDWRATHRVGRSGVARSREY